MTPEFFEKVIVKKLFKDIGIKDKLIPYLNPVMFDNFANKEIVKMYIEFHQKHDSYPSMSDMKLVIDSEKLYEDFSEIMSMDISEFNNDNLILEIEDFIKNKLYWNGIRDGAEYLKEGEDEKLTQIPDKLREALSFSFDNEIGLDFTNSAERMYDSLHQKDKLISTGIREFDKKIEGGFHEKSLTLFLAECIDENTIVKIRYKNKLLT